MNRGRWLVAGFGVGLGIVGAIAMLLWFPRTRRFARGVSEEWLDRVTDAVREGVRAARTREAQLEGAIILEEAGLSEGKPDYIV